MQAPNPGSLVFDIQKKRYGVIVSMKAVQYAGHWTQYELTIVDSTLSHLSLEQYEFHLRYLLIA